MENKIQLLKKLGFSDQFLRIIESNSSEFESPNSDTSTIYESGIKGNIDLTTLIIDKTEKPINDHFVFNEK